MIEKHTKPDQSVYSANEINHPSHYTQGRFEVIDVIEDWKLNFHLGNVIKYVARCGHKDPGKITDLEKARWYLQREIDRLQIDYASGGKLE
jgi:hypothetical protein